MECGSGAAAFFLVSRASSATARFKGGSYAAALQDRGNKARMFMKTKDRNLMECGSEAAAFFLVSRASSATARFKGGSCAAALQDRRNKARMFMKTKDERQGSTCLEHREDTTNDNLSGRSQLGHCVIASPCLPALCLRPACAPAFPSAYCLIAAATVSCA